MDTLTAKIKNMTPQELWDRSQALDLIKEDSYNDTYYELADSHKEMEENDNDDFMELVSNQIDLEKTESAKTWIKADKEQQLINKELSRYTFTPIN